MSSKLALAWTTWVAVHRLRLASKCVRLMVQTAASAQRAQLCCELQEAWERRDHSLMWRLARKLRGKKSGPKKRFFNVPSSTRPSSSDWKDFLCGPRESLSHRLERTELLNDHRDELLLQCAQSRRLLESFLCRTWLVEGDVASFQPFCSSQSTGKGVQRGSKGTEKHQMGQPFMSVFAAFVNGLTTETLGSTGLEEGRDGVAARVSQEARLGTGRGSFLEMWHIRETHPKGGPVRTLVRYRMCLPDPALQEDAQSIPKLAHILRKVLLHRKGTEQPPTNNERKIQSQLEQRREKVEGKYAQGTKLTSMRQIWQKRWPYGVLERKTRSSNELLFSSGVTAADLM